MMKAVILAAGLGTRLGNLTATIPKCLLTVKGGPLLDYLLTTLNKAGISETIVVAGYLAEKVREFCAGRCKVIVNDKYESTNNIFSVWLARSELLGHDFIILNCDVIYDQSLLIDFVRNEKSTACLIDNVVPFRANEFHVLIKEGRIVRYSKEVSAEQSGGESAQLVKITAQDSGRYLARINDIIQQGGVRNYHISAYDVLIQKSNLWPIFTMGRKWFEIDTLEDYENVSQYVQLLP
jgi:choline kinase